MTNNRPIICGDAGDTLLALCSQLVGSIGGNLEKEKKGYSGPDRPTSVANLATFSLDVATFQTLLVTYLLFIYLFISKKQLATNLATYSDHQGKGEIYIIL